MVAKVDLAELSKLSQADLAAQFPLHMVPEAGAVSAPMASGTQPNTVWTVDPKRPDGLRKVIITGRKPLSNQLQKLNPLWLATNADDPTPPAEYMPWMPNAMREFMFTWRNIGDNAKNNVVGVEEYNYFVVIDQEPYDATTWQDVPANDPNHGKTGYKTHTI